MRCTFFSFLFGLVPTTLSAQAALPETISVWVSSYIPDDTDNEYIWDHSSGATVVAEPLGVACYATDERGPSDDPEASARLMGLVKTELVSGPPWIDTLEALTFVGETTAYGCATNDVECVDTADAEEDTIEATRNGNLLTVSFDLAAGNPCNLLASHFGAIDIEVSLVLNLLNGEFTYEGAIAEFPNYEMYIQYDDDDPVSVFSYEIDDDSSPEALVGEPSLEIEGTGTVS